MVSAVEIRFISRRQLWRRLAYSTNTHGRPSVCLSASRVYFSHEVFESSGEARRSARKRRDGLLRVARRNHGVDVEGAPANDAMASCEWRAAITAWMSNPAKRRLEPLALQRRYLRLLDDHKRRGRQPSEKRRDLADARDLSLASNRSSFCRRSVDS
jgi:hypothetical protein